MPPATEGEVKQYSPLMGLLIVAPPLHVVYFPLAWLHANVWQGIGLGCSHMLSF